MASTAEFRAAFVQRLTQACDASSKVPPMYKGRQQFISKELQVAPEAVSKWFKAVSMPRPTVMVKLAELLGVEQTWLAFGVNPEMDRKERKEHAREVDGAVHLVMGLTMMEGANCGLPGERDPRSAYVDFYATIKGTVHMVHVCMGREITEDRYELAIPKEYAELSCVAVIPFSRGKCHLLDLPVAIIQQNKIRKNAGFTLIVNRSEGGRYTAGDSLLPRIRYFGEKVSTQG